MTTPHGLMTPYDSQTHTPVTTGEAKKNTLLRSHGRAPWYGVDGKPLSDAFVIGIAGGSASGKTHVAQQIVRSLGSIPSVVILSQDSFYRWHNPEEIKLAFANEYDFDHPDSLDLELFAQCLSELKACKQTNIPVYSFSEHQRLDTTQYLYGAAIIITEGILALHDPALRALYDLKVFVQCDSDLMLARRIRRDVTERGRSVDGILDQYLRFVKPSYDNFVQPTAKYADIIVPGASNNVAIELIVTHVQRQLDARSVQFRERMARASDAYMARNMNRLSIQGETDAQLLARLNLHVLEQTPQLLGIYTILRDKSTTREDFIFYADRLATLVIEKSMDQLPFQAVSVTTPTETETVGKQLAADEVCGVSILRSGGPLERGLQKVIRDVRLGSLLIQSDPKSGEPLLLHTMLPECVRQRSRAVNSWVFLLDAQIGTGASALMAIRVLLDHGVQEDHIVFVTFIVALRGGISAIRRAFPRIRIVCGAVDQYVKEGWMASLEDNAAGATDPTGRPIWSVVPGLGHVGDRYYL